MSEEKVVLAATKIGIGAATGIATGVSNVAAPHLRGMGTGAVNASTNFFNGATKALKNHKGVAGAVSAGTAALLGHGVVATAVVAAAPVVAVTAAAGAAAFGLYKLVKYVQDEL
jgi:hypothetical protein